MQLAVKIFFKVQNGSGLKRLTSNVSTTFVIRVPISVIYCEITEPVINLIWLGTYIGFLFKHQHGEYSDRRIEQRGLREFDEFEDTHYVGGSISGIYLQKQAS